MHAGKELYDVDHLADVVDTAAEVLSLLSDATRIRIILALKQKGELSVGELAEIVDKKPSGVSQHLARMRMVRMVTTRHEGTSVFYRLIDEHALALVTEAIKQAEHSIANGQIPPHHDVAE